MTSLADEICYLESRYMRVLSASGFQGVQVCCRPRGPSLPHQLQKPTVVLTDFAGFFKSARMLLLEAANVVTEARFRELVESGYSAEILCQGSAHKLASTDKGGSK